VTYDKSCERIAKTQNALNRCVATELGEVQHLLKSALSALPHSRLVQAAQSAFGAYGKAECTDQRVDRTERCEVRLTVLRIQEVRQDTAE
jgi:hypothetical protein